MLLFCLVLCEREKMKFSVPLGIGSCKMLQTTPLIKCFKCWSKSNKNVDIKFNAHDPFCNNLYWVTYKIKGNESTIFHYNEIRDWNSFPILSKRVRVMLLNATFNNVSGQFYWRRNRSIRRKPPTFRKSIFEQIHHWATHI